MEGGSRGSVREREILKRESVLERECETFRGEGACVLLEFGYPVPLVFHPILNIE